MDLDAILIEMNNLANNRDAEFAHEAADKLLVALVERLAEDQANGRELAAQIVQSWNNVKKWYS